MTSGSRSAWRRRVVIGGLFVAVSLVMVGARPSVLAHSMPGNLGDPALLTWVLAWGWHALTTRPVSYFNGNMFWPARSTLAYSDVLTPVVAVFGPLWAITDNWALSINLTVIGLFVFSLIATYCLARRLVGRTDAAVISAFAYTFCGTNMAGWSHIQIQTLGVLPFALLCLLHALDEERWYWGAIAGFATATVVLAAGYWGALWIVVLPFVVVIHAVRRRRELGRPFVTTMATLAAVAGVLLLPAAYAYLQFGHNHMQPLQPDFGLKARDLITVANGSYVWGWINPKDAPQIREHGMYPGVVTVVLAAFGLAALARRRLSRARRGEIALVVIAGCIALVLALGPEALGVTLPFRFLHDHVPAFGGIRVTVRWTVLAWLALAVLAGAGAAWTLERLPGRRSRALVATGLGLAVLVDLAAPLGRMELPSDAATLAVYHALDRRPSAPTVELPMVDPGVLPVDWAYVEAPRLVWSSIDWNKRVNGYSAFYPASYLDDVRTFDTFPSPASIGRAGQLRVRYVVIHGQALNPNGFWSADEISRRLADLPATATVDRYGPDWLVDLGPTRP